MADDTATAAFRVLYICRANHCRSPVAELLLSGLLAAGNRPGWSVGSAGIAAAPGSRLHPMAQELLAERDLADSDFRARQLTDELVEAAGLILTAERSQRAAVALLQPGSVHRTFTMNQFARLVKAAVGNGAVPTEGPELIRAALDGRGRQPPGDLRNDDISDPMGRSLKAFRECFDQIEASLTAFGRPLPERRHTLISLPRRH